MASKADFTEEQGDAGSVLRVSGRLTLSGMETFPQRLDAFDGPVGQIDIAAVERVDTVGAWVVHQFAQRTGAQIVGASDDAKRLMTLVSQSKSDVRVRPEPLNPVVRVVTEVGDATMIALRTMLGLISFSVPFSFPAGTLSATRAACASTPSCTGSNWLA
jgi:phospholipid/cholesterol/gamma-HCH transport system permease protein